MSFGGHRVPKFLSKSVYAEKLPGTLFLYEEFEKSGPESIGWPPRFQYGWFLQILTLNGVTKHEWGLMPHEKVFMSHKSGWIPDESGLKKHDN